MSGKYDPQEKLLQQIIDGVERDFSWMAEEALGDSPIEKLFYLALNSHLSFQPSEFDALLVAEDGETAERLKANNKYAIIVEPQKQIGAWRVDFLISAYRWAMPNVTEGWQALVVECDGHAFHERTKEQAARDRARDRGLQSEGYTVFRFTGSELWRDPLGCAEQVVAWARKFL